jgi:hypothetical protein
MVESLWSIPATADIRTPLAIMKEQASALTDQTNGSLVGYVETTTFGDGLRINLSIQVPALNNYRYQILTYNQPITMYPGRLQSGVPVATGPNVFAPPQSKFIENEQDFMVGLKALLTSQEVTQLVTSLLAQANAA